VPGGSPCSLEFEVSDCIPIEGLRFMISPFLLALDTATETCSVALLKDGAVVALREAVGQRHSERALPMVDAILRDNHVALGDLDAIAFGAGPGSFTGLRIACGLAQGLAWGAGKQVIAVGNLMALAARVFEQAPDCHSVLCAIDARMHEAYCAVYRRGPEILEDRAPQLARPGELAALAAGVDAVAGDALAAFPEVLPGLGERLLLPGLRADAADIVRLAATDALQACAVAPHDARPVYVRDHVALTTEERRLRAATA
jgi:tRNA threonylcarbamoyladenosine biosynthesis protein TsaB